MPLNAAVQVQVSEPVSTVSVGSGALVVAANGQAIAGTVTVNSSTQIQFQPASLLAAGTAYTVTVAAGAFMDLAGNPVQAFSSSFTTGTGTQTTGPQVVSIVPQDGTSNVATNSPVVVTFSEAVNPLTVNNASVNVQANGNTVAGTYKVSGAVVTFTPQSALPGNATVQVLVDHYGYVYDLVVGNRGEFGQSTFTTANTVDTTQPTVVSVSPVNGATGIGFQGQVVLTFSKSMNPATLTACCNNGYYSNVVLLAKGQRLGFTPSVSYDNRTLTLSGFSLPVPVW